MKNIESSKANLNKIKMHSTIVPKAVHIHGGTYEGQRKDGAKHGEGTFIYSDGSKYVGLWNNDKMQGQGTLIWACGEKYVGEWNNDEKHGYGIYIINEIHIFGNVENAEIIYIYGYLRSFYI